MLALLQINGARSEEIGDLAEKFCHIGHQQVPVMTTAGFALRLNIEKHTVATIPIGAIVIIPSSDIGVGNIQTNASLLAETEFTFWILSNQCIFAC